MRSQPFAIVGERFPGTSPILEGWRPIVVAELPAEPFDLTSMRFVVIAETLSVADAGALLMAAARGCSLILSRTSEDLVPAPFLEDLGRMVDVVVTEDRPVLDADQVRFLERLASGATIVDVAAELGWSRRTAARRLADVKRRLAVTTTSAAVRAARVAASNNGR
jgi:DNA-binding NarL/FixJ family response regulator